MRTEVPETHTGPKSLYLVLWNWGSHEEVFDCQGEELDPKCSYLTQVSTLESLRHGIFMEISGDQAEGRASQLPYLAVASVVKSFSWDPSFTLAEMSEIICPPWGNKRARRVPGSPQGRSWGAWPASHPGGHTARLSWVWRKSTNSIPSTHSSLPESRSIQGWLLGLSCPFPSFWGISPTPITPASHFCTNNNAHISVGSLSPFLSLRPAVL